MPKCCGHWGKDAQGCNPAAATESCAMCQTATKPHNTIFCHFFPIYLIKEKYLTPQTSKGSGFWKIQYIFYGPFMPRAHVMAMEVVCILLNICIISEAKSPTAEYSGAGLGMDRTGGRAWIWARPKQTRAWALPEGSSSVVQEGRSGLNVPQSGVSLISPENATQGKCDTGFRLFGSLFP